MDNEIEPYEHPAIEWAIAAAVFHDNISPGVKFPRHFNPIPLPAAAFVLTMVCPLFTFFFGVAADCPHRCNFVLMNGKLVDMKTSSSMPMSRSPFMQPTLLA